MKQFSIFFNPCKYIELENILGTQWKFSDTDLWEVTSFWEGVNSEEMIVQQKLGVKLNSPSSAL